MISTARSNARRGDLVYYLLRNHTVTIMVNSPSVTAMSYEKHAAVIDNYSLGECLDINYDNLEVFEDVNGILTAKRVSMILTARC